ncbi:hypothetical protein LCGC14_2638240 [marine sediment metagenome]|uniref:Uncharacterized protein n=1 Tax=marine sediment metagenome TaxID=412755 RepID=A0A0F9C938_9ZZZZ
MEYILTIWLFWSIPFDAILVEVKAPSCKLALESVMDHVRGDGVSTFEIVSCHLVQDT